MSYQDIAKHLRGDYQISSWMSQIVTITCDQKNDFTRSIRSHEYSMSKNNVTSVTN